MTATTQLILFDIDGTLIRGRGLGRASTKAAMLEVFGTFGLVDTHHFGGKTDWQILTELLIDAGYTAPQIGEHLIAYEAALTKAMLERIDTFEMEVLPGAMESVLALRDHPDMVLGLVTGNVAATAHLKLQKAGFDPAWFPIGAYGSESAERNDLPPLALQRAIQYTGYNLQPQQVTVIGDTENDIACAQALGARSIAVLTGFAEREALEAMQPDILLDDLTQLLAVI